MVDIEPHAGIDLHGRPDSPGPDSAYYYKGGVNNLNGLGLGKLRVSLLSRHIIKFKLTFIQIHDWKDSLIRWIMQMMISR